MKLSNKKKRKALKAVLKEHLRTISQRRICGVLVYSLCADTEVCLYYERIDDNQYHFVKDLLKEEALKKGKHVSDWVWDSEDHESRTKWLKDQIKKLR